MINYEVNLEVDNTIHVLFLEWLYQHVQELLVFDGFKNVRIFEDTSSISDLYQYITVHYELDTMDNLQSYFDNHAPIMREKTRNMFNEKVKASRRVLKLTKSYNENIL